jgi:hypothetical protein
MSVTGVGGAASLPAALSTQATAAAASATGSATSTTATSGEPRLPGQRPLPKDTSASAHQKPAPQPAPLPPLKVLTVSEFRAMLGVALPTGATQSSQQAASSVVQAAATRYA